MAVYDDLAEERLKIFDRGVERGADPGANGAAQHQMPVSYRYGDIVAPHIALQEPLVIEDQHFVDCIRNSVAPSSGGEAGLSVMMVLDAIDRSLLTGARVELRAAQKPTLMTA
jgi:predicted dehydrogenase